MTKHTPGPWNTIQRDYDGYISLHGRNGVKIGTIGLHDASTEDAHLIAAAPELLEAARWTCGFCTNEMVKLAEREMDPKYREIMISAWKRILDPTLAAIAKAEGK